MKKVLGMAGLIVLGSAGVAMAANSLGVNNLSGLNGTGFGMEVSFDANAAPNCAGAGNGSTNNVYVETAHPTDETHYLMRFWVNPNNLSLCPNKSIRLGVLGDDGPAGQHVIVFLKRNDADNSWRVNTWYKDETGAFFAGPGVFIVGQANPNQARQVEIEWTAATSAASNNGILSIRRLAPTAAGPFTATGIDNAFQVDYGRFGILAGSGAAAQADTSYKFDEFESYR